MNRTQEEVNMSKSLRHYVLATAATAGLLLSPLATSHFDDKEIPQSYRQSWFAMVAANFGPMAAMVKGEMPWDQQQMAGYADQLAALTTLDVMRGFADGSDKGTTRAKPEIWENKPDFEKKLGDLRSAVDELQQVANTNDRKAIATQVAATGKACKACHDDYKSKNYLY
jgi:cytochrome c556